MIDLKPTDRRLLRALQTDATIGLADLAEQAGMSRTSCWRRIKEFEDQGVIDKRVTLLNPAAVGLHIHVLLMVSMREHSDTTGAEFENHVENLPEVLSCFRISGDRDYLLHVVAEDIDSYTDFLSRKILHHRLVRSASSSFALKRVKTSTVLPL